MAEQKNDCKYCGEPIPQGHYCCDSCWKLFEEGKPQDDDEDEEES